MHHSQKRCTLAPRTAQLTVYVVQMVRQHRKRYDLRCEPDGTWTVYDIFTGMAYHTDDHVAFAMDEEFARVLVEHLNQEYVKNRFKE